jgi:hypothetical protein
MQEKDLIIGAVTNYNWDKIKYWANSIVRSGFKGDKVVLVFNGPADVIKHLHDLGFETLFFQRDDAGNCYANMPVVIVVDRFFYLWQFLCSRPNTYRYVISTDVKDVVFQTNPSEWLLNNIGDYELLASGESLTYQNEPWGDDNLKGSFPFIYESLKTKPIWNCGVQAGRQQAIQDLWIQLYLISKTAGRHNGDQAAYNMLLNSRPWKLITKFTMSESGWACQAGTTVDPLKIESFKPHLLEPTPVWSNELSHTSQGLIHAVVHQWDRVPNWHADIERRYG